MAWSVCDWFTKRPGKGVTYLALRELRGRRLALGALFFLEDGEDEACADDGDEPNELGLEDLLLALEDAALENADGEPSLESDDCEDRGAEDAVEEFHGGRRNLASGAGGAR